MLPRPEPRDNVSDTGWHSLGQQGRFLSHVPYAEVLAPWVKGKSRSYGGQEPGGCWIGCCGTFIWHNSRPQAPTGKIKPEDELPALERTFRREPELFSCSLTNSGIWCLRTQSLHQLWNVSPTQVLFVQPGFNKGLESKVADASSELQDKLDSTTDETRPDEDIYQNWNDKGEVK